MILLVGDPRDPHVPRIADEISARGGEPFVFCKYNRACRLSMRPDAGGWSIDFHVGTRTIAGEEVSAVWWRQKPFTFFAGTPEPVVGVELVAEREWYQPLQSLPHMLGERTGWINDPWRQIVANLKPFQLGLAARVGLDTPETLLSSDKADIRSFVAGGDTVYKGFSGSIIGRDQFVFTTEVDPALIAARDPAELALAPGIYQRRIAKAYEMRVVIVDEMQFAIRIDSQRLADTQVDWRRDQKADIYTPMTLDPAIAEKLHRFMAESGLRYGAIDAIVTPDGEFCFLECNPAGQWLWLEHFTGLPISAALAAALCRSAPG